MFNAPIGEAAAATAHQQRWSSQHVPTSCFHQLLEAAPVWGGAVGILTVPSSQLASQKSDIKDSQDVSTSNGVTCKAAAQLPAPLLRPVTKIWLSDLFKMLVTHLQMLGVLRNLKLSWPSAMQSVLIYFDQTQAVTTWWVLHHLVNVWGLHGVCQGMSLCRARHKIM